MPAVEVEDVELDAKELQSYELAFHILPTIAEGEVSGVFDAIKALIIKNGGEIFDEEAPERFSLAYEIVKHIEGKNRKFHSAYFAWVRFKANGETAVTINAETDSNNAILRHLLIKLTRVEEENPFRFHDAIRGDKKVTDFADEEVVADADVVDAEAVSDETTVSKETTDSEKEV